MVNDLVREGAHKRTAGKFYVAVVQAMLFFGPEMLVVTPRLEKATTVFHHRAVLQMAGTVPKQQLNGTWVYPPIGLALETMGI